MAELSRTTWRILRELAAELVGRYVDHTPLEKISHFIETQRPSAKQLVSWLNSCEQDAYLAARSNQTWSHYQYAGRVVRELLNYAKNDVYTSNLLLAWLVRLMRYYKRDEEGRRAVLDNWQARGENPILADFKPKSQISIQSQPLQKLRWQKPATQSASASTAQSTTQPMDPFAETFMKHLQNKKGNAPGGSHGS